MKTKYYLDIKDNYPYPYFKVEVSNGCKNSYFYNSSFCEWIKIKYNIPEFEKESCYKDITEEEMNSYIMLLELRR